MSSASDPTRQRINALEVVVTLCLTYTLCIFFGGLWIRRHVYGLDEVIASVATILSVGQFATQYVGLSNGLGKSSTYLATDSKLGTLNIASLAGVILFLLTLYLSKCGAITLISRFAQPGRHMIAIYAVLAVTILLGVASILEVTIGCGVTSAYYWDLAANSGHCSNQYLRWQVATAFDITTEILILALPIDIIWGLSMPATKRISVLIAFWVRLPVLALSIARNHYIHTLLSTSDAGLASGNVVIFQEVEMTFSLTAVTLMTLRHFAKDFNTGFGLGGDTVGNYGASVHGYSTTGYTASNSNQKDNSGFNNSSNSSGESRTSPGGTEMQTRRSSQPTVKDTTSLGRLGSVTVSVTGGGERPPSVRNALKQSYSMRSFHLGSADEVKDKASEPKESKESILREQDTHSQKIYKNITFSVETEPAPADDLAAANTLYPGNRIGHAIIAG